MIFFNLKIKTTFTVLFLLLSGLVLGQNDEDVPLGDGNFELEVEVVEGENLLPLNNVNVYLFDAGTGQLISTKVTNSGLVYFDIEPRQSYQVQSCKQEYVNAGMEIDDCHEEPGSQEFCVSGSNFYAFRAENKKNGNAQLSTQLVINKIEVGKTFDLENIYFELDESFLQPAAKSELDKIYDLLKQYPSLTIELSSHTDSRGSSEYNQALSQRRAESSASYLFNRGIDRSRIDAKGYGEQRLVNECSDGVKCSDRKHQLNRRTEFKVLSIEGKECETPEFKPSAAKDLI